MVGFKILNLALVALIAIKGATSDDTQKQYSLPDVQTTTEINLLPSIVDEGVTSTASSPSGDSVSRVKRQYGYYPYYRPYYRPIPIPIFVGGIGVFGGGIGFGGRGFGGRGFGGRGFGGYGGYGGFGGRRFG